MRNFFIHESSFIDEPCSIGDGTKVWHFCHIQSGAQIGERCTIGQNVNIGPRVRIGNDVKIQNNVSVYEGVEIEDFVFCGPSMVFTNVRTPRGEFPRGGGSYDNTVVRRGATLGANCTVVCGVTIGEYSFIGAGAVVTKNVPAYALVFGNPAEQKGWVSEAGCKLDFSYSAAATCERTGLRYQLHHNLVSRLS